jgi:threonine dehydratase
MAVSPVSHEYLERILKARVYDVAIESPLEDAPRLSRRLGNAVLFKREDLQPVFSFKVRGAYNKIAHLSETIARRGVICASAGNHAQGVALAARRRGIPATIVMPQTTPRIKVQSVIDLGGEVILHGDEYDQAYEHALEIARERQLTFIHPFDDADVIAGQGTTGLEIMEEVARRGVTLDAVLVNVSGGGLASGITVAVKDASPSTEMWTVEPAGFDDFARSLASGKPERNERLSGSICDALMAESPGELTLTIGKALMAGGVAVTDAEAAAAVRFAFEELKLVLEPGGAAGLAAILTGKVPAKGRSVAVILSGGNADPARYARIINGEL